MPAPSTNTRPRSPWPWTLNNQEDCEDVYTEKAYFYGTGEKSSVARVRLIPGGSGQIINNREFDNYFGLDTLKTIVKQPLELVGVTGQFDLDVGSGRRLHRPGRRYPALAWPALCCRPTRYRPLLKKAGFLTRDPRMKERKKYGLKAARRAPQFSKR